MPEVRAGNATVNVRGDEAIGDLQRVAARIGHWLPVDVPGHVTVAQLCDRRDGGPREARYGALRARVLSLGAGGLRFGSEAVKDVAGYDVRRAWLGEIAVEHATLRLAARLAWRHDLLLRGGSAFELAERLRSLVAAPAAILVLAPDVVAVSDDAPESESARRLHDLATAAATEGAEIERSSQEDWLACCDALPQQRVALPGRLARTMLPGLDGPWVYDAGRRLALVADAAGVLRDVPPRGPAPSRALVARVRAAIAP